MKLPITRRRNHAAFHDTLDSEKDRGRIFEQLIAHEFPVEFLIAAEIAQFRSFTIPNGSKLLHRTAEFEKNSLKRLDDTRAILVEMGRDGFDSPTAATMAAHLNEIHGFYTIPNDEFLYTLSTFIFDVVLFINRYGWRQLTQTETEAIYFTYRDMGELMNIADIPPSFEAFWAWRQAYEREEQAYSAANHQVAMGLLTGLKLMVPRLIRPLLLPFVLSLEDRRFAELLGFQWPHPMVRALFRGAMWIRSHLARYWTLWDVWSFEELVLGNFQTYPRGYEPLSLGPEKLVSLIEKRRS